MSESMYECSLMFVIVLKCWKAHGSFLPTLTSRTQRIPVTFQACHYYIVFSSLRKEWDLVHERQNYHQNMLEIVCECWRMSECLNECMKMCMNVGECWRMLGIVGNCRKLSLEYVQFEKHRVHSVRKQD